MSERYKFHSSGSGVIRLRDGVLIMPGDTAAWREYMERVYSGYEAEPADPEPPMVIRVPKVTLVERMTDSELEDFREAKKTFPARLVFLWDEAPGGAVDIKDQRLIDTFRAVIGDQRTQDVLKP